LCASYVDTSVDTSVDISVDKSDDKSVDISVDKSVDKSVDDFEVVLVTVPFSAMQPIVALAEEMQMRKHAVKIASLNSVRDKVLAYDIPFLDLGAGVNSSVVESHFDAVTANSDDMKDYQKYINEVYTRILQKIVTGLKQAYPPHIRAREKASVVFVISGIWSNELIDFCEETACVMYVPTIASAPVFAKAIYLPFPRSTLPYNDMTFGQRFRNAVSRLLVEGYLRVVKDGFMDMMTSVMRFNGVMLIGSVPGMDYPSDLPPLHQYVGPLVSKTRMQHHLPADLLDFISRDYRPVLYISMGSLAQLRAPHVVQIAASAFPLPVNGSPSWKVVWALTEKAQKHLPEFVRQQTNDFYISNWIETPSILKHPATKLFLSHCGGNGAHESVYLGVPLVCIPFFGDQMDICDRVANSRIGACIPRPLSKHTPAEIHKTILQTLFNRDVQLKTNQVQHIMRRYRGVDAAADWVELVHALKGDVSLLETTQQRSGTFTSDCYDLILLLFVMCCVISFIFGLWKRKRSPPVTQEKKQIDDKKQN